MKSNSRMFKTLTVIACISITSLVLTGCTRPHAERYQKINKVIEQIDYTSAGTIIYEEDAPTNGYVNSSYLDVLYDETSAYKTLYDRMIKLPNFECGEYSEKYGTSCESEMGTFRVSFGIVRSPKEAVDRWKEEFPYTYLNITDPSNGASAE